MTTTVLALSEMSMNDRMTSLHSMSTDWFKCTCTLGSIMGGEGRCKDWGRGEGGKV